MIQIISVYVSDDNPSTHRFYVVPIKNRSHAHVLLYNFLYASDILVMKTKL